MQLHEVQAAFAAALLTGNAARIAPALAGEPQTALRRLQIYRNHYLITLGEALAATFPVTQSLVGARHFDRLARHFAEHHPPKSPCLFEYGGDFSQFLQRHPIAIRMPMLPDLARLEWAMNLARTAPDVPPLAADALRVLPPARWPGLRFALHPASQLVSSRHPLDRIWRGDRQPDTFGALSVSKQTGVRLLILRDGDGDVAWRNLTSGESTFFRTLRAGLPLGQAAQAASAKERALPVGQFLLSLIEIGAFAGFQL